MSFKIEDLELEDIVVSKKEPHTYHKVVRIDKMRKIIYITGKLANGNDTICTWHINVLSDMTFLAKFKKEYPELKEFYDNFY